MKPPRRLRVLSREQLRRLTRSRLLAYRKKALSLENCPQESDYSPDEVNLLGDSFIWFKSDPRWQSAYELICEALENSTLESPDRGRKSNA
jgi:hypothetical protein